MQNAFNSFQEALGASHMATSGAPSVILLRTVKQPQPDQPDQPDQNSQTIQAQSQQDGSCHCGDDEIDLINNPVLEAARNEFLDSLPDTERSQFSQCYSTGELLQRIEIFAKPEIVKGKSPVLRTLRKIQKFSEALEPYFHAISSMTQANPYAAIAWGSVLFVFKVC